jgi:hypothetical protein
MVVKVVISYKKDRIGCFYQNKHFVRLIILSGRFPSSGTCISMGCALLDCTGWMGWAG